MEIKCYFSDSKSALHTLLSKWDHPTVHTIMIFVVFIHTAHKNVLLFCWFLSQMGITGKENEDSAAKVVLQKHVSTCIISYTDAY